MKLRTLLLIFALVLFSHQAPATTYYVEVGGGTATQCTGLSSVSYGGSGTGQACAWGNPQYALPPGYTGDGAHAPRIATGDTLVIGPGTYPVGYGTLGAEACQTSYTYACVLDLRDGVHVPNGVTITGMFGGTCSSRPILWGSYNQSNILDLTGTTNVTVSCLDLTDHAVCIDAGNYTHGVVPICANNYPTNSGVQDGIDIFGATNPTISQMHIHGFGRDGMNLFKLVGATMDHTIISGNGLAGWDGAQGTNDASNSGTILIKNSEISWNGCIENSPAVGTYAVCIANGQGQGGYGDGLGTYQTAGNWRIINDRFLHNASDGLDLLYARGASTVFVDHVTSGFNASQQIKASGNSTIQNSIANGDCSEFLNSGLQDDERCRASGNAIEIDPTGPSQTITVQNTTITGTGDCLIISGDPNVYTSDPTDVVNIKSNILLGQVSFLQKNEGAYACGFYVSAGTPTVNFTTNLLFHYRNNTCGGGLICADPKLKNETGANFDATPLAGSPALGGATVCTILDWGSQTRGNPCTIGAIETTTTPKQPNYAGN